MPTEIVDKFTTHLKEVLTQALSFATKNNQDEIMPEHLLWALGKQKGCIGAEILQKNQISTEHLKVLIEKTNRSIPTTDNQPTAVIPTLSKDAKRAIEKAVLTANIYEHRYVGTEHLLSGLLQIKNRQLKVFFDQEQIDLQMLREQIAVCLKGTSKFPEFTESIDDFESGLEQMDLEKNKTGSFDLSLPKTPALDFFSQDLTDSVVQEKIDPVIARDQEIQRVMEILCRRTKNNPILLGEPGVGKTAIVEGLAKMIVLGTAPAILQDKRIMALDMSLVVAGTMYRGEFEERLRQVIDEVRSNPNIILFIDEIHIIAGAGSSAGSMDAANILKPALARGEVRCIGATTTSEFKKNIESDAALERRFQTVVVNEPSQDDTSKILKGLSKNYEEFHGVKITEEAIQAAIELSVRHLPGKYLPDKAIDLIDEAAAAQKISQSDNQQILLIVELERQLRKKQNEKRQAIVEERFRDASQAKDEELQLQDELRKIKEVKNTETKGSLIRRDIAAVISKISGIPLSDLLQEAGQQLLGIEKKLSHQIIGQKKIITQVADAIRRAKTGLGQDERPLASFLFVGPSGVGKTELARVLAQSLFQSKDNLIRLDMSEYAEGFTVSKLIGAPAGYVGYRESAKLTDQVKQKSHCLILFDELEKAHPDVQNLLLQILENGELSDATGRKINFRDSIIVITSNVGLKRFTDGGIGFSSDNENLEDQLSNDIRSELEECFRPELINRIDHLCFFNQLRLQDYQTIAEQQLKLLKQRLDNQNVKIEYNNKVIDLLAKQTEQSKIGARAIRQMINQDIEAAIAAKILKKPDTDKLKILVVQDKIKVHAIK